MNTPDRSAAKVSEPEQLSAQEKWHQRRERKKARMAEEAKAAKDQVADTVPRSSFLRRHRLVAISFVAAVLMPMIVTGTYLWAVATNQYASYVSFAIRSENPSSADVLGGLAALTGMSTSSSSDTEVLYAFFHSQDLVDRIDKDINLRAMWSKDGSDPLFRYGAPGTVEDLTEYWQSMVQIIFDANTGIIDIRALAFTPEDAQAITTAIFSEGTKMINELSDIAREDMIRYSREDLDEAADTLRDAREAISVFRNTNQIVDPSMDTQGQMGILGTLQSELANAMVELDMLTETTRTGDPRIAQGELRISVIQRRISEERRKMGMTDSGEVEGSNAYANLVGEFERLTVDRQFAEQSYTAALANFKSARAEAGRQSRYLAAHVAPTKAEQSQFPSRMKLFLLMSIFMFLIWAVAVLVAYSLKDRR